MARLSESANSWKGGTEELGLETRRPFMQEETYYRSEEESTEETERWARSQKNLEDKSSSPGCLNKD